MFNDYIHLTYVLYVIYVTQPTTVAKCGANWRQSCGQYPYSST